MREVTLFWKRARVQNLDISGLLDIFNRLEFISYVKRIPRDIRVIIKANFCKGKGPSDIVELPYLELIEVILKPKDNADSYLLLVKLNHSVRNLNARTNGTSEVPGSRLDGEGLTYIIQGPPIKLRIVSTLARMISQPDRISARSLDFDSKINSSVLNGKQLKLAKFAYDRGYFEVPKRTRISDLASEIGLARATISENLARIESIIMDDMFSSFDEKHTDPKLIKELIETIVLEFKNENYDNINAMISVLKDIKHSIEFEIGPNKDSNYDGISSEEMIEMAVKEHKENISIIDDLIENKFKNTPI